MNKREQILMFSSVSDEYETPTWLYKRLDSIFCFTLDPAASDLSHMCSKYYTIKDDGLQKSWAGETCFLNPPYSKIKQWSQKATSEFVKNDTEIVMLVPARTETIYWHKNIWGIARYILFLRGRLKFINKTLPSYESGGKPSSAPFPSAVICYTNKRISPVIFHDIGYMISFISV